MLKRFTNVSILCLLVSACNSVPGNPDAVAVQQQGEGQAVESYTGTKSPAVPIPPIKVGNQALFDRALGLLQSQQYLAAEVLLIELTQSQPGLAGPWVNLGYVHLSQQRIEQAHSAFIQAIEANPSNCDALNQLGVMARQQGQFDDAEGYYKQCIEAQPGYGNAHLNLAILYELYMGRFSEALVAYQGYQLSEPEPDTRVVGWVMDLERRISSLAQR
ncbi:MAG: tetratricopeptide repeat protein [Gammaproteobacteria bacterium]|nr:tetratricopeptide repeat protein [Gammaproteobacteria bacterium]